MQTMIKSLQSQRGFSLIELMVVVATLGIVAAIAVPNFLRYQAQSRQSEAKSNLAGIFASELAFFGENSRYSGFSEIGFSLAGSSNRYTYRTMRTTVAGGVVSAGPVEALNAGIGTVTPDNVTATAGGAGAVSSGSGFTATATANLDNDATIDSWHVNDLKQNLALPDMNDVLG
jgi:type IV pilus assembly protein PilA